VGQDSDHPAGSRTFEVREEPVMRPPAESRCAFCRAVALEHDEIARYGTLIAWAEELGHDDVVRFLTTNLNEEKAANTKLNTVALRKGVNRKAAG
jgi:ferritin-like metal-binding protein YciE